MSSRFTPIHRICAWAPCGKPFTIHPTRGRDILTIFCSTVCRANNMRANRTPRPLADLFWAKVAVCDHGRACRDCCWPWQASKGSSGYGTMWVTEQGRLVGAHVVAWFLETGQWPAEDMEIMHHCPTGDMRACVNFPHLHEGTHIENMQDLSAKGGYANQFSTVTHATRDEIVAKYLTGAWTYDSLGRAYGLSAQSIYTYVRKHRQRLHNI